MASPTAAVYSPGGRSRNARETLRGGGWNNPAENLRSAIRNGNDATDRNDNIGFRLAAVSANTLAASHRAGAVPTLIRASNLLSPPVLVDLGTPGRASGWALLLSKSFP